MKDNIQNIIELINEFQISEAFEKIEEIPLSSPDLGKLKKEYRSGAYKYDADYADRLLHVVKRLAKELPEYKPTPPSFTLPLDKIESYIAYLTTLRRENKSFRCSNSGTRDILGGSGDEGFENIDAGFEKIIGDRNNLKNINWLLKGLKASRSVCRVVRSNGEKGTGFVLEGGYLLTNWHVLPNVKAAENAKIEFNYEQDADGNAQKVATYFLDTTECKFSPLNTYDYAYVKIKDDNQNPLSQWGTLTVEDFLKPEPGQPTIIIQHPEGGIKQIAFEDNNILSVWKPYLFYETDTLKGSSGSPVLNSDWKVIALHHYGKNETEGGVVINEAGEKRSANRGVLMEDIMKELKKQSPS